MANGYTPAIDDRQGLHITEYKEVTLDLEQRGERASVTFKYIPEPYSPMASIVGMSGYPKHWTGGDKFCRVIRRAFKDATGYRCLHLYAWINSWLDSIVIEG